MRKANTGCGHLAGHAALLIIAIAFVAAMTPRAKAQNFTFMPISEFATLGSSVLFSALTITANATTNLYNGNASWAQYNITCISGIFDGNAINGLLAPNTSVGVHSVNNTLFSDGVGFEGTIFVGRDETPNNHLSLGFGFTTDAGSFLVCDGDCVLAENAASNVLHVYDATGRINSNVGQFTSAVAMPGPLAGAGMLSYLAVLLMGLALRGKWLLARTGLVFGRLRHTPA